MKIDAMINSIIEQYGPLSSETILDFIALGEIREIRKGDILVREGEFSQELYYLGKGGARAYYLK